MKNRIKKEKAFANARNTAAGTLKLKDSGDCFFKSSKFYSFFIYTEISET